MQITNTIVTYPDGGPTRYWVGGSGDWNDPAHWSDTSGGVGGSTVPSYSTAVIVDDSSTIEGEETLTITWSTTVYCEFLTTTITTPCLIGDVGIINVTDGVTLSETTSLSRNVSLSNIDTTVYWTVADGKWTYMDTYYYTEAEWTSTTPEDLQSKQVAQYIAWREYCKAPIASVPEVTSIRIEGSV